MSERRAPTDAILARHWISHPDESAYQVAKHLQLEPRTVQKAAERLRERVGLETRQLVRFVQANPIKSPRTITLRHPNAQRWLRRTPQPFLLSGEDAAVIDGWDIVPNRHLIYVDTNVLHDIVRDALDDGARLTEGDAANLTIRERDPWLVDEKRALVERGQRMIDYAQSKNVQFLIQMRERMPEGLP